jgi:hypothetical protein
MLRTDTNKSGAKTKIIIAMLIAGVLMISGLMYWLNTDHEKIEEPVSAMQPDTFNMPEKEFTDAQKVAAVAAVPGKTVSGTVTERPAYVSEMEWQVLQNVASQNPDVHLTDLVNKLLFIKKKTAWLEAEENSDQRRQLARQLLEMIPGQLEIEAIDPGTAKELETMLHADLIR